MAMNEAIHGRHVSSFDFYKQYIRQKYGNQQQFEQLMPGEIEAFFQFLSLAYRSGYSEQTDFSPDLILQLVDTHFLSDVVYAGTNLSYLERFQRFDTNQELLDAVLNLLLGMEKTEEVEKRIFMLAQQRFIDAETRALTRRFVFPLGAKINE